MLGGSSEEAHGGLPRGLAAGVVYGFAAMSPDEMAGFRRKLMQSWPVAEPLLLGQPLWWLVELQELQETPTTFGSSPRWLRAGRLAKECNRLQGSYRMATGGLITILGSSGTSRPTLIQKTNSSEHFARSGFAWLASVSHARETTTIDRPPMMSVPWQWYTYDANGDRRRRFRDAVRRCGVWSSRTSRCSPALPWSKSRW